MSETVRIGSEYSDVCKRLEDAAKDLSRLYDGAGDVQRILRRPADVLADLASTAKPQTNGETTTSSKGDYQTMWMKTIGDKVQLNSGGPNMTITAFKDGGIVVCEWNRTDGTPDSGEFLDAQLMPA